MLSEQDIQSLTSRIVARFKPERIVLFGSHATGTPRSDSDLDLLVILPFEGGAYVKAAEIRAELRRDISIDLVARTPEDVARRYRLGDPVIREAIDRGIVLYAAAA